MSGVNTKPDPDAPALVLAAWLNRDFPVEARTFAEFIRRKAGIVGTSVDDIADCDRDDERPALRDLRTANSALAAFADMLSPLPKQPKPIVDARSHLIHPALSKPDPTLSADGILRYPLTGRAVLKHVPLGVTVNGRAVEAGATVYAGDVVEYTPLVLKSGGQDLSFEFEFDDDDEEG